MSEDDEVLFADEQEVDTPHGAAGPAWKVLIADDEEEVHRVSRMALDDFQFEGRGLELLDAYSGKQTEEIMAAHPDVALLLLDVVMERDHAGLDAVRYVRNELHNGLVRIILRTGQPGQAPEREVITQYDINDYKEKTELTSQKLFTTVTAALRGYRDLCTIEKSRKGLQKIIDASAALFEVKSLRHFTSGVLTQLTSLLGLDDHSLYMQASGFAVSEENGDYAILAGTGRYEELVDRPMHEALDEDMLNLLIKARNTKRSFFQDNAYVGCFWTEHGSENILYIEGKRAFSQLDQDLIRIFSTNVAAAFDNLYLNKEIIDTQKEMVFTLGDVVETRSKETVRHVQRVAEYARLLGVLYGLSEDDIELLRLAAPMHDVGKIGIPDAILNKPGKLTPEEFEIMKTHTTIGHDILKGSQRPIFKAAATIALQHHEHWNGQGYPRGLLEGEAHIFSRICGLVDVFDALSHKRCYKGAWGLDVIVEYLHEERGAFFDPALVDLFMAHVDDFVAIKDAHPNPE